jgi:hypothetical protein
MQLAERLRLIGMEWTNSTWPLANIFMIDMKGGLRFYLKSDGTYSKFNGGHVIIVCDLCLTLLDSQNIQSQ